MNKINFQQSYQEKNHGTPHFPFQSLSQCDTSGQYFAPYHWHQDIEILYVIEGEITLYIEGEEHSLKKGEIYFINPGTLHGVFGKSLQSHHYALLFHPDLVSFSRYDLCQNLYLEPLFTGKLLFPNGKNLPEDISARLRSLIQNAADAYSRFESTDSLFIKICILQIIELLFRNDLLISSTIPRSKSSMEKLDSLKEIFLYIDEHYMDKITLEELANRAHMNKNYFCKYFRTKTGKTPFTYLTEYRVNKAAALLLRTDLSITEISLATGFENMSYFIRQFKNCRGCTPTSFRQMKKF